MATVTTSVVPLESGDRLTREEFHRRYYARPDLRKAELINGVVYVASPMRHTPHAKPVTLVHLWLGVYAGEHDDAVDASADATLRLGPTSEVQPDGCLFRRPPVGRVRETEDSYLEGPPELVFEVAASSASYDLHDKKELYRRAGMQEYIVWRTLDGAIDWFRLVGDDHVRVEPDEHGVIESTVFPGLRLPVERMLAMDRRAVRAAVETRT